MTQAAEAPVKPFVGVAPTRANLGSFLFIYGFFLFHMAGFGSAGFHMAYDEYTDFAFNLLFSGFAIGLYLLFYCAIFGVDEIKWLFINSALGILGIVSQLDWILAFMGYTMNDFPWYSHIIPAVYFIMYTFLLRRLLTHLLGAAAGMQHLKFVEWGYVGVSLLIYLGAIIAG